MSDLSRSLVDAAAGAVEAVILAKCPPNVMPTLPPGCTAKDLADGAAAAVLETLAAHCDPVAIGDGSTSQALLSNTELRRLAVEARTES